MSQSIPEIFAQYGEPYFRELERHSLETCLKEFPLIATGGGIVVNEANRKLLREQAFVIYLQVSLSTLEERLVGSDRPLLQKPGVLGDIFRTRQPLYEACAHLVVNTESQSVEEVVSLIASQL